uniref:hypothetical protein n=1 Tax=Chryseobacterium indologenes TaxID=253 RepID=UPI0037435812
MGTAFSFRNHDGVCTDGCHFLPFDQICGKNQKKYLSNCRFISGIHDDRFFVLDGDSYPG